MKSFLRVTPAIAAASIIALAGTGLATATAADVDLASGGNPPGGWLADPEAYTSTFGGANAGTPQGTLIADSGFRPYPHGFPLPNWGTADEYAQNELIFGVPTRVTIGEYQAGAYAPPATLNSLALRRTVGDGVCRNSKAIDPKTGECELILGAELLAQLIEVSADGGRCLGMATAAAALYNGQLDANQVGASGLGINAANPMDKRAVETITRLYGTQVLNVPLLDQMNEDQSPTSIVQTLVDELPAGQVPYVLTIIGEAGGHAITPYAVTDQGNGVYDIAVYDNNYPFQAHAVTVDTNADTYVYTSATNPNAPEYTWSTANGSVIALVAVDDILAQQPCPVCRGEDQGTVVGFNSIERVNADEVDIELLDMNGDPLSEDAYIELGTANPSTKTRVSQPVLLVEPGVDFLVQVHARKLKTTQPFEVYLLAKGNSEYLLMDELRSNSAIIFGGKADATEFVSSAPSSPHMEQLYDGPKASYNVTSQPVNLPRGAKVYQDWNRSTKQVQYAADATTALKWNVQVSGVNNTVDVGWAAQNVTVPAGSSILVDYSKATPTNAPQAWVVNKKGSRTAIAMQPMSESLVQQARDTVFATMGTG